VKPVRWFSFAKDRRNATVVDQYLAALRSSSPAISFAVRDRVSVGKNRRVLLFLLVLSVSAVVQPFAIAAAA
jgi:hypothetical protein